MGVFLRNEERSLLASAGGTGSGKNGIERMRRSAQKTRRWLRQLLKLLTRLPGAMASYSKRAQFMASLNLLAWPVVNMVSARYRALTRKQQRVVVVIGSLGKTTTTRATLTVMMKAASTWVHAWNNCFALVGINLMRQGPRAPFAVVEVGIGSRGQMGQYALVLQPDMAVVTSISTDHLHRLGGAAKLWEEKS